MNQTHTLTVWLLYFYVYSFIGWIWESCYVSCLQKKWVNRGFIKGPLLPLYGSGALVMLLCSSPFSDNMFYVYLAGMIGATVLEFITGAVMEALFKVRYWDYSNQKFNLKGYICLSSSLVWGLFTVLLTSFIHPAVRKALAGVPPLLQNTACIMISVGFCYDFLMAFHNALQFRSLLEKLSSIRTEMVNLSERIETVLSDNLSQAKSSLADGLDKASPARLRQQIANLLSFAERIPPAVRASVDIKIPHIPERILQWKEQVSRLLTSTTDRQRKLLKNHTDSVSDKYSEELTFFKLHLFENKKKDDEE